MLVVLVQFGNACTLALLRKGTVKTPLFLLSCSLQCTTYYMYCIYALAPLRLISKCTQENCLSHIQTHKKHCLSHTQTPKNPITNKRGPAWSSCRHLGAEEQCYISARARCRPASVSRQAPGKGRLGIPHTCTEIQAAPTDFPSVARTHWASHSSLDFIFFFLSFLFGVSSSCASKNRHWI